MPTATADGAFIVTTASMKNISSGFTLLELTIMVAIVGTLAALAVPQYQIYVVRTQVMRTITEAGALRTTVESCLTHGQLVLGTGVGQCDPGAVPSTIISGASQLNATLPPNTGVPQVANLSTAWTPTITATFGNNASNILSASPAGTVTWTRNAAGSWSCSSANIGIKYKPADCP